MRYLIGFLPCGHGLMRRYRIYKYRYINLRILKRIAREIAATGFVKLLFNVNITLKS